MRLAVQEVHDRVEGGMSQDDAVNDVAKCREIKPDTLENAVLRKRGSTRRFERRSPPT